MSNIIQVKNDRAKLDVAVQIRPTHENLVASFYGFHEAYKNIGTENYPACDGNDYFHYAPFAANQFAVHAAIDDDDLINYENESKTDDGIDEDVTQFGLLATQV